MIQHQKSVVTLTNNGTITLSGANSAGIFAKNGIVKNTNDITVGKFIFRKYMD